MALGWVRVCLPTSLCILLRVFSATSPRQPRKHPSADHAPWCPKRCARIEDRAMLTEERLQADAERILEGAEALGFSCSLLCLLPSCRSCRAQQETAPCARRARARVGPTGATRRPVPKRPARLSPRPAALKPTAVARVPGTYRACLRGKWVCLSKMQGPGCSGPAPCGGGWRQQRRHCKWKRSWHSGWRRSCSCKVAQKSISRWCSQDQEGRLTRLQSCKH